ncbi:hypothetical protein XF35_40745 [Streptomyces platensis subsp. clarensis]|uniref:Uncharacterized protein n=1 Tax=Streptomyces showdoensis TaxID=68268 RepID=A0A2P2GED1_STREW|nr:hypothetical protein [Streptomyces showdoensis]KKZ69877.1 hypothetical protein VO63_31840 [Streptomyces showdoensis]MCW7991363.1 hypothetical protein [Streptomyces platensis subsp. clarensis]
MDPAENSPLAPDPDLHETGGFDGPNPSGRLVNADQFGHGMRRVYSDSPAAPVGHARMRTMRHWSKTPDEPCRPDGGVVNDEDNGLVPGYRLGTDFQHAPAPEFPSDTWPARNVAPIPKHQGVDDGFEAEVRSSQGGRR